MKHKQLRTFRIEDKEMVFNVKLFRELFLKNATKRNIGIGDYEYELAESLYVDKSAVHNWRMGVNGPSDIGKIQLLAKIWNIKYEILLVEENAMNTTMKKRGLSDRERSALKNVYVSFLNYMNIFKNTAGFIWNEDGTTFNMIMAYGLFEQVNNALELEYVDLKGNVYDDLRNFYDKEFTYTLEASYCEEEGDFPEMQQAVTEEVYEEILKQFKEIINPFLITED